MNIVLIGYRGTGKTKVGEILSNKLGLDLVSTDAAIVEKAGKTIPEIVKEKGWDKFRDIETEVVKETTSKDNIIIDCGGGVVLRQENVDFLKQRGKIFLLTATVEKIAERIKDDTERPALKEGKTFVEEIEEVLNERKEKYNNAKDFEIDGDNISIGEMADKIIEKWQEVQ